MVDRKILCDCLHDTITIPVTNRIRSPRRLRTQNLGATATWWNVVYICLSNLQELYVQQTATTEVDRLFHKIECLTFV
jgi:hypothetical protein